MAVKTCLMNKEINDGMKPLVLSMHILWVSLESPICISEILLSKILISSILKLRLYLLPFGQFTFKTKCVHAAIHVPLKQKINFYPFLLIHVLAAFIVHSEICIEHKIIILTPNLYLG